MCVCEVYSIEGDVNGLVREVLFCCFGLISLLGGKEKSFVSPSSSQDGKIVIFICIIGLFPKFK